MTCIWRKPKSFASVKWDESSSKSSRSCRGMHSIPIRTPFVLKLLKAANQKSNDSLWVDLRFSLLSHQRCNNWNAIGLFENMIETLARFVTLLLVRLMCLCSLYWFFRSCFMIAFRFAYCCSVFILRTITISTRKNISRIYIELVWPFSSLFDQWRYSFLCTTGWRFYIL